MYLNKMNVSPGARFQSHPFDKAVGVMSPRCLTLEQAAGEGVTGTERGQGEKHTVRINRSRDPVNATLRSGNCVHP